MNTLRALGLEESNFRQKGGNKKVERDHECAMMLASASQFEDSHLCKTSLRVREYHQQIMIYVDSDVDR
jgi:hypothetical protein